MAQVGSAHTSMHLRAWRCCLINDFNATLCLNSLLKAVHARGKLFKLSGAADSGDHESYTAQVSNKCTSIVLVFSGTTWPFAAIINIRSVVTVLWMHLSWMWGPLGSVTSLISQWGPNSTRRSAMTVSRRLPPCSRHRYTSTPATKVMELYKLKRTLSYRVARCHEFY